MTQAAAMIKPSSQALSVVGAAPAGSVARFGPVLPTRAPRPLRTFAPAMPVLRAVHEPRQLSLDLRQR